MLRTQLWQTRQASKIINAVPTGAASMHWQTRAMSSDAPLTALKRKAVDAASATPFAAGASAAPVAKKPKARCGACGGGHKTGFVNC